MPMRHRCHNWNPAAAKPRKFTFGPIAATTCKPGRALSSFDYQPGRSGAHARRFLGDWRGHLLVDDYAGYKALFTPDGHERGLY